MIAIVVITGVIILVGQSAQADPASAVTLVAVDLTIAGNDDSAIGTIDDCGSLSIGETLVTEQET